MTDPPTVAAPGRRDAAGEPGRLYRYAHGGVYMRTLHQGEWVVSLCVCVCVFVFTGT